VRDPHKGLSLREGRSALEEFGQDEMSVFVKWTDTAKKRGQGRKREKAQEKTVWVDECEFTR